MPVTIGIRREDKNEWERRVPVIPEDIVALQTSHGLRWVVQSSPIRVYRDEEYRAAGITVCDDIESASVILGIKEIPGDLLLPGKTYVCFAHIAKGQAYNMPFLRRLMELGCTILDYEKITDDEGRRLIFFGRHAGYAGMVEALRCLGKRLETMGLNTPLAQIRHPYQYADLGAAKGHLSDVGKQILLEGLPASLRPLVIGFSGYGNVSRGAQEVLDCLRVREVAASDLAAEVAAGSEWGEILKVVFREADMVRPKTPEAAFSQKGYYSNPEDYVSRFEEYLPYLDVLINAIYWEPRYPRLVSRAWAHSQVEAGNQPRLKIIADISCDIEGSIEFTVKATKPDNPCFVYNPADDTVHDGVAGPGLAVMAVDNLPCEFPREASIYFSSVLRQMTPSLAEADWGTDFDHLDLPSYLKKAVIVYRGQLTPSYRYLEHHLESSELLAGKP